MASSAAAATSAASLSETVPPYHILLFYRYCPVPAPLETVLEWQRSLCAGLQLTGRIRLATEGINATLAGSEANVARYITAMNSQGPPLPPAVEGGPMREGPALFAGIEYKRSTSDLPPFDALGMFLVPELTASGKMGKSRPPGLQQPKQSSQEQAHAAEGGQAAEPAASADASSSSSPAVVDPATRGSSTMHLTPAQWHEAVSAMDPATTLLLDTRNTYETAIGTFAGACDPKIRAFHQLPEFINQNLPAIRSKKRVLMFCTGGIRCEKASLYLAHRAPDTEILQLEGGIHKYLDAFPDGGHFKGKNFVFDGRLAMGPEKPGESAVVGRCVHCATTCDHLSEQDVCAVCKSFLIFCEECRALYAKQSWTPLCPEHILLAAGEGAAEVEDPKHKHRAAKEKQAKNNSSPGAAEAESAPAAAGAAASSVAAASSPPAASAGDSECGAAMDSDSAASPSAAAVASLACLPQFYAFLSRFTLAQLSAQLREIDAVLAFFAQPAQKKSASRSRNRKANLFKQRRRIAGEIQRRVALGEKMPEQEEAGATSSSAAAAVSSPQVAAPLLSFVPFLNV